MALADRNDGRASRLRDMVRLKVMQKLNREASANEIVLWVQQHGIRTREGIRTMQRRGHGHYTAVHLSWSIDLA